VGVVQLDIIGCGPGPRGWGFGVIRACYEVQRDDAACGLYTQRRARSGTKSHGSRGPSACDQNDTFNPMKMYRGWLPCDEEYRRFRLAFKRIVGLSSTLGTSCWTNRGQLHSSGFRVGNHAAVLYVGTLGTAMDPKEWEDGYVVSTSLLVKRGAIW
jgi:hypothetical protein